METSSLIAIFRDISCAPLLPHWHLYSIPVSHCIHASHSQDTPPPPPLTAFHIRNHGAAGTQNRVFPSKPYSPAKLHVSSIPSFCGPKARILSQSLFYRIGLAEMKILTIDGPQARQFCCPAEIMLLWVRVLGLVHGCVSVNTRQEKR